MLMPTAEALSKIYEILLLFTGLGRWPAYRPISCALGLLCFFISLTHAINRIYQFKKLSSDPPKTKLTKV